MEYKKLTESERTSLKVAHKQERDGRVRDRIKAVLLYDEGYSMEEIAKVLLLSNDGIRKQLIDYHSKEKLKPENGGSHSKLSMAQEKELIEYLEINNYVYAKDIGLHIERRYGISYTLCGVVKLLC